MYTILDLYDLEYTQAKRYLLKVLQDILDMTTLQVQRTHILTCTATIFIITTAIVCRRAKTQKGLGLPFVEYTAKAVRQKATPIK